MNEAKNTWNVPFAIYSNPFFPPYDSMFVCLSELIHSVLGLTIRGAIMRKDRLLSPDTPFSSHKRHALYFYEPCDLFCFVVRPLGMYSMKLY